MSSNNNQYSDINSLDNLPAFEDDLIEGKMLLDEDMLIDIKKVIPFEKLNDIGTESCLFTLQGKEYIMLRIVGFDNDKVKYVIKREVAEVGYAEDDEVKGGLLTCASCGGIIFEGKEVVVNGEHYHEYCID